MKLSQLEKAVEELEKAFPDISGIHVEDGYIHLGDAGEGGEIDGMPSADYWAEDYEERYYVFGVSKVLEAKLKSLGLFAEWQDAGTLLAYPA